MTGRIIDGKCLGDELETAVKKRVDALRARGITPCLAVVLVGENPASKVYVNRKSVSCEQAGISARQINYSDTVSENELLETIRRLDADASVHAILVQLPLPAHLSETRILQAVSAQKDVDGFHFQNLGKTFCNAPEFVPNTPRGVLKLIQSTGVPIAGKHCVVVGRSLIVGRPAAMLLLHENATVTLCHSKTKGLSDHTRTADILVVAVGKPRFVTADMVKVGAIVIDVGINRMPDHALVGDVDYESVKEKASFITPVPGGVGPMTVACLLENTVFACEQQTQNRKTISIPNSKPVVVGVLASTRGTDLQAIIDAIESKQLNAKIGLVIANKPDAYILERAKKHAITGLFVDPKSFPSREAYDTHLALEMKKNGVQFVLCIGYNKIITKPLIDAFENRILNVHPSLLPAFAGKFDADVHQDVLDAGVKVSGATVHIVTKEVDAGPIVAQRAVSIEEGETRESLKSKVQAIEGEMLVDAIRKFAEGKVR